jgi:hypothetical protein
MATPVRPVWTVADLPHVGLDTELTLPPNMNSSLKSLANNIETIGGTSDRFHDLGIVPP